jgi:succinyldiaminopimelate transaminase
VTAGFVPPTYPYERLDRLRATAAARHGEAVDLSVGTPNDPPPPAVIAALASSGAERGYPRSAGSPALLEAAGRWMARGFEVDVPSEAVAACVGTKELVAGVPRWLRLRHPGRDTVLYPAVSYPTYAMGAVLAGCRPVPVPVDGSWRLDLGRVDDANAERALCLWVNSPGNPAGGLDDLAGVVAWARERAVPVFSDECYVEFTWDGPGHTVLEQGLEGVVAVHSLSKRSNAAGVRSGFYAGDPELVGYLAAVRQHAGLMVPGPSQAAATAALDDDGHVVEQRHRYRERLESFARALAAVGVQASLPGGGFYVWAPAPGADGWGFAEWLAVEAGCVVAPGELYGPDGAGHVRAAMVHPAESLDLVAGRLEGARLPSPWS